MFCMTFIALYSVQHTFAQYWYLKTWSIVYINRDILRIFIILYNTIYGIRAFFLGKANEFTKLNAYMYSSECVTSKGYADQDYQAAAETT